MNTVLGLHSLKRPSLLDFLFCRWSSDHHQKKRGFFFSPPQVQRKAFRVSGHKGIWMSQRKAVGMKQWCYSGNTRKHGFRAQRLRMAPSPPGAALRHKDRPVCIEFPLDCSVIVAVTEQRHRGALSPASSLKGPEQFPPPLPSTNPAVMSSTVSFALSVCPSARPGFFFCPPSQGGEDAWEGDDDGEGGLAHAEHQSLQRCHVLPCHPVHPRHRRAWGGRKHTSAALTHTASKQMGGCTNTAVRHGLSPLPQSVHSRPGAQRTNTSSPPSFPSIHPSIGGRFTPGDEFFIFFVWEYLSKHGGALVWGSPHGHTLCWLAALPTTVRHARPHNMMLGPLSRQLAATQRKFFWVSYPEIRLCFKTKQKQRNAAGLKGPEY